MLNPFPTIIFGEETKKAIQSKVNANATAWVTLQKNLPLILGAGVIVFLVIFKFFKKRKR
jgi:hypothetical protein